jgi:hypothetical protein
MQNNDNSITSRGRDLFILNLNETGIFERESIEWQLYDRGFDAEITYRIDDASARFDGHVLWTNARDWRYLRRGV